jgi:hypothetical protein
MALMLWDLYRMASVKASRIREITITLVGLQKQEYSVKGWYNANESFSFGCFPTEKEAQKFVEGLHEQMKEEN